LNPWVGPYLDPCLHLGSSNHEFFFFFWSKPINLTSKMVTCRISIDLPLFGLCPSFKGHESNLWLSTNRIVLFHWSLDLEAWTLM
jgi:hypothetical protein